METHLVTLKPRGPVEAFPSSDTLFGAVCWGIRRLYGKERLLELLEGFEAHPWRFILSSAFPRLDGSVLCFPRPASSGARGSELASLAGDKKGQVQAAGNYKTFQKFPYVTAGVLALLRESLGEFGLFQRYGKDILDTGDILHLRGELKEEEGKVPLWKKATAQKNSIDRFTWSTTPGGETFYTQEISLSPRAGLYFFLRTDALESLLPVLRYLEDSGIGGNRSVGRGFYKIEVEVPPADLFHERGSAFMALSRYLPEPGEVDPGREPRAWTLLPVQSKVESAEEFDGADVQKKRVAYLAEGAVIGVAERREWYGRLADVTPAGLQGARIYQNGLALPLFGDFGG